MLDANLFFKPSDGARARYRVALALNDEQRRRLAFDFFPDRLAGPVGVDADLLGAGRGACRGRSGPRSARGQPVGRGGGMEKAARRAMPRQGLRRRSLQRADHADKRHRGQGGRARRQVRAWRSRRTPDGSIASRSSASSSATTISPALVTRRRRGRLACRSSRPGSRSVALDQGSRQQRVAAILRRGSAVADRCASRPRDPGAAARGSRFHRAAAARRRRLAGGADRCALSQRPPAEPAVRQRGGQSPT